MLSKSFLANLAKNISIGKQTSDANEDSLSFGGLNVILCRDLHQFPPVAKGNQDHLFRPTDPNCNQVGRAIYEQFNTVVFPKEQKRVTDPVWHRMLSDLQKGQMEQSDLSLLRQLVISSGGQESKDFHHSPWIDTPLVMPCHAVWTLWNEHSIRKWCQIRGQQLFISLADATIGGTP
jgi:hypothetical protein